MVDARVMPKFTSGNTNNPTLMIAEDAAHRMAAGVQEALEITRFRQSLVSSGQGFPPNREIPESSGHRPPVHFTYSMQSSICIPRAEETNKSHNSNMNQHPNEV